MFIFITLLIGCIIASLAAIAHYRAKYWNYLLISKSANEELKETKRELTQNVERLKGTLKQKFKKELEKKYKSLASQLEQEYNEACEEVKQELFSELEKVDIAVKQHVEELSMKNILTFSCSCSRDLIPVAIDFSKENTFICPKCGSKYKIAINANPILVGRDISDEQFADLVEKRLNESKN